jgi:hypothetical protein
MTYDDWKAPKQDRQALIWPAPSQIFDDSRSNARSLGRADVLIAGIHIGELRSATRAFVGIGPDERVFVTGHQCELWHPGVWAKNVLIDSLARRFSARALHLAVDTDAPKHLDLRFLDGDVRVVRPITDDPSRTSAAWASLLSSPSPSHLREMHDLLAAAKLGFEPSMGVLLESIRSRGLEQGADATLTAVLADAFHRLDWSLGLDYVMLTLSPLLESDSWLTLVLHLIQHASRFAHDYNAALATYRYSNGIDSSTRPMPDLSVSASRVELPLWLDDLDRGIRSRASVVLGTPTPRLIVAEDALEIDPSAPAEDRVRALRFFLRRHRLRLAPRALVLTLFARLLIADVFVHGIGGGRYDQVTDLLIASHFGIAPPSFAVATATLYWPGSIGRSRACLSCVRHAGHQLRHGLLGARKHQIVQAIDALPRRSRARAELFADMQRQLEAAWTQSPSTSIWQQELDQARADTEADAVHFDREITYAMQPLERLVDLITAVRQTVDA